MAKKQLNKYLLTAAVVLGGLGFLIYSSVGHAQHYKMVDALMVQPDAYVGKEMKIHGYVEPGSIKERIVNQQTVRTFVLEKSGKRINVENSGPKPDTFKDQSEVVAQGRLEKRGDDYVFVATDLQAKCPSKYDGAPANKLLADKPVYH